MVSFPAVIEKVTEKAVLFKRQLVGDSFWIAQNLVKLPHDEKLVVGSVIKIAVPEWFYEKMNTGENAVVNTHSRGGYRAGAGRPKGTGKYQETTTPVRVPKSMVKDIENHVKAVHGTGNKAVYVPDTIVERVVAYAGELMLEEARLKTVAA